MKRVTLIPLVFLVAGFGCFLAFNLTGSTVDEQGFLHEPFFLLPAGNLMTALGLAGFLLIAGRHIRDRLSARR